MTAYKTYKPMDRTEVEKNLPAPLIPVYEQLLEVHRLSENDVVFVCRCACWDGLGVVVVTETSLAWLAIQPECSKLSNYAKEHPECCFAKTGGWRPYRFCWYHEQDMALLLQGGNKIYGYDHIHALGGPFSLNSVALDAKYFGDSYLLPSGSDIWIHHSTALESTDYGKSNLVMLSLQCPQRGASEIILTQKDWSKLNAVLQDAKNNDNRVPIERVPVRQEPGLEKEIMLLLSLYDQKILDADAFVQQIRQLLEGSSD